MKMGYTDRLYRQEINIDDVPAEWQEEVQFRVNELIADANEFDQVSDADRAAEEALAILAGEVEA